MTRSLIFVLNKTIVCWKKYFGLISVLFLFPSTAHTVFDEIVQDDLQRKILPMLGDPLLETRLKASRALLNFPEWSLPLIRDAIQDQRFHAIHWRLAYLLSVLGTQADIPLLLESMPSEQFTYQSRIWRGAAERLFWRHRQSESRRYIISRLRFLPEQRNDTYVRGRLLYKIVNPDSEGRLVHIQFDLWYARLEGSNFPTLFWIEAGRVLEVELPLSFTLLPGRDSLRIDLKVEEVGTHQSFVHHKIQIPLTPP